MQNQVKECAYKNVTVRLHFPDRAKDEQIKKIKVATEKFMKKIITKGLC